MDGRSSSDRHRCSDAAPANGTFLTAATVRSGFLQPAVLSSSFSVREQHSAAPSPRGPSYAQAAPRQQVAVPPAPEREPTLSFLESPGRTSPVTEEALSLPVADASPIGGANQPAFNRLLTRKSFALSVTAATTAAVAEKFGSLTIPSGVLTAPLLTPTLSPPPVPKPAKLGRSLSLGTAGLSLRPTPPQGASPALDGAPRPFSATAAVGDDTPPPPDSLLQTRAGAASYRPTRPVVTQPCSPQGPPSSSSSFGTASSPLPGLGATAKLTRSGSIPAAVNGGGAAVAVGAASISTPATPLGGGATPYSPSPPRRQRQLGRSPSTQPASAPRASYQQQSSQHSPHTNQPSRALSQQPSFSPLQRLQDAGLLLPPGAAPPLSPRGGPVSPHLLPPGAAPPLSPRGGPVSPHLLPPTPPWQRPLLASAPPQTLPPQTAPAPPQQPKRSSAPQLVSVTAAAAAAAGAAVPEASPTRSGPVLSMRQHSPSSPCPGPGGAQTSWRQEFGAEEGKEDGDEEGDAAEGEDLGRLRIGVEIPPPPEVALRTPRWLKLSAFQITEQLRSGRLQELVDRLAAVTCPTLLDLGGLEFSGSFCGTPGGPSRASASGSDLDGGGSGGSAAFLVPPPPDSAFRHTTMRFSASGGGPGPGGGGGGGRYRRCGRIQAGVHQVLAVPPGQHVTICNATLLLTAEQYILVGRGASLTLKGVEILGCSREAAMSSALFRRRILNSLASPGTAAAAIAAAAAASAAAAAAAAGGTAAAVAAAAEQASAVATAAAAAAAPPPTMKRRSSLPGSGFAEGNGYQPSGAPTATGGRRASVGDATNGGLGVPPSMPRRSATNTGGVGGGGGLLAAAPPLPPPPPPPIQVPSTNALTALVDPNEYVDDHALLEVQGGQMRLSDCRIWPGRCQLALCVSEGACVGLSSSAAGATCAAGARSVLVSQASTFDGGAAGCVSVLQGAAAALTGCRLRLGREGRSSGSGTGSGSEGECGAGGEGEAGLEARGDGTRAVLIDCELSHCGLAAADGATAHLQACRLSYARADGLYVYGTGTALYGRELRVEDSGRAAAAVVDGATLRLAECTLVGSNGPGVSVFSQPVAAPDWQARAGLTAAAAPPPAAAAALLRCTISANAGHGAAVSDGGSLELSRCEVYNNAGCGLAAAGGGAALAAAGVKLIRNEGQGVRVAGGAEAALWRVTLMRNGRDGVAVEGRGSRGKFASCESRENRESGLCVTDGAAAELRGCRLAANQHDGLSVGGAGSRVAAAGCTLAGNTAKGAVVCMGGRAELSGCALHCNGSKSAKVADEGSRLVLAGGCSLDRQPVAVGGGMLRVRS